MALDLPLIAAVTLVLAAVIYNLGRQRSSGVLPPGPPPTWLIGNRIPSTLPWRWFEGLTKRYGPLTTVWIGRRPLIVVGTFDAAADVLEKQGSKSPSRPQAYWASTLLSGGMRILLVPSGERWRRLRKASHTHLQPSVIGNYEPLQTRAASNVLLDILHDPDQHQMHAKRYAASLILTITCASLSSQSVLIVQTASRRRPRTPTPRSSLRTSVKLASVRSPSPAGAFVVRTSLLRGLWPRCSHEAC